MAPHRDIIPAMPEDDPTRTITIAEAARRLGVSRNTAYSAAHRGQIPSVRIGHLLLVPLLEFNALMGGDTGPPSPHTRKYDLTAPQSHTRYTEEEDETIRRDYAAFVTTEEIARKLGRTLGSVRQRINMRLRLRRPHQITRLMGTAPDHLKTVVNDMPREKWLTEIHKWRREQSLQEMAERRNTAYAMNAEAQAQANVIADNEQLSRNEKIRAMYDLDGMTLEAIADRFAITRERVRQVITPIVSTGKMTISVPKLADKIAKLEAKRNQAIEYMAMRLVSTWERAPAEARALFLAKIKKVEKDEDA